MQSFDQEYEKLKDLLHAQQSAPVWLIEVAESLQTPLSLKLFVDMLFQDQHLHGFSQDKIQNLITQGVCGNILWIKKNSDKQEINLEEVESVFKFASQKPFFPGRRIIIIEYFDALNRFAVNSLLKLLEEPPAELYIYLLTRNIGEIYPTICSRSSLYYFNSTTLSTDDSLVDEMLTLLSTSPIEKIHQFVTSKFDKDNKKSIFKHLDYFLYKLSRHIFETHQSHLSDRWLEAQKFLREAKETHLDPIHTFVYIFGVLKGLKP
ncbi:MAG: hypothetical protein C0432_05405 [Candidatus Puniceispirillum sp.]|nr:hypothetical protein [Candidatus Pelagibacter sp.]MBA4283711.1 hypothetical protein [Candidatus Puniceispirillum sp.]